MNKSTESNNSVKNQSIKSRFVDQHVQENVCQWVQDSMETGLISLDDISNNEEFNVELSSGWEAFSSRDCLKGKISDLETDIEALETEQAELDEDDEGYNSAYDDLGTQLDAMNDDIDRLNEAEPEYKEIYEYWVVSSWLLGQLEMHGECIVKTDYANIWGRCCTGQAIQLDDVVSEICERKGYLVGQENSGLFGNN